MNERAPTLALPRGGDMRKTIYLLLAAFAPAAVHAQGTQLRAVSAFAENTEYVRKLETFIKEVNAEAKGALSITFIGGPKSMPPSEVANAVRTGVTDIAMTTGAVYSTS